MKPVPLRPEDDELIRSLVKLPHDCKVVHEETGDDITIPALTEYPDVKKLIQYFRSKTPDPLKVMRLD